MYTTRAHAVVVVGERKLVRDLNEVVVRLPRVTHVCHDETPQA